MKCKTCGHEIFELETIEVEGFTITKPIECEKYPKDIPKGFRLPKQWELFKIFGDDKNNILRKEHNTGFYWSSTIFEDYSRGLYLSSNLDVYSDGEYLAYSGSYGRVVFVKVEQ